MCALLLFNSIVLVPSADAQVPCPAFAATTGPIDLLNCSEFKPGNSSATTLTNPAGLAVNDVLIALVQVDDGGTDANFTMDPYWSTYGPEVSAQGIESQVYFRVVQNVSEDNQVTNISWTGGNERFYAILLHFRGANQDFDPDVGVVNNQGNDATPPAPAFTTEVDNTLVLRMLSLDRSPINEDVSGLNAPAFNDIALDNTGNGNGGISGGVAYREEPTASTLVAQDDWILTGAEQSHTRTFGLRPAPEFRFSLVGDTTASVCGVQEVTLDVVDADGNILDWYQGTVDISIVASSDATGSFWAEPGAGVPGVLNDLGNGTAQFTFDGSTSGTVTLEFYSPVDGQAIDFDVSENGGIYGESPNDGDYTSPTLSIVDCEFVISFDDSQVETCAMESVTITLQGTNGEAANFFTGTLTIDNGSGGSFGNYTQTSGSFVLNDAVADDGQATYPFAITPDLAGTPNVLVFDYIHADNSTADIDFALTDSSTFGISETGAPLLSVESCTILVTLPDADLTRDVCTVTSVTFEIQAAGSPVSNFDGNINLSAAVGLAEQGFWYDTPVPNPGTLTGGDVGDGTATYDFNGTEGGTVTLDYRNAVTATGLTFEADGITDDGITLSQSGAIPSIDIGTCLLTITTASVTNITQVCRGPEDVTYTVTSPDGRTVTNYDAIISLSTTQTAGDYADPLNPLPAKLSNFGNGAGTFELDGTEGGVFTLEFSVDASPGGGVINLLASGTGLTIDTADADLTINECVFEIEFLAGGGFAAGNTDVCSVKQVQITLRDSVPSTVDDYTGQIFLSTSTGFGSWSADPSAQGTLVDTSDEDGAATYTFDDNDDGVVILNFTHTAATATALNVDVTDLVTTDPGTPGSGTDPNLNIAGCYFEISYSGGTDHLSTEMTACEVQDVTIEVYNSLDALASDFAGQINITTDTDNGNWDINTGMGTLNPDPDNDDDGAVSYTFVADGDGDPLAGAGDNGSVILNYSNLTAETVNFDVVDFIGSLGVDGTIVEDGAADPSIEIGSCIPTVADQVCAVGGAPSFILQLPIAAQNPDLLGRKVVVATMHEVNTNTSDVDVSSVQFDRDLTAGTDLAAFAELIEERAIDNFELTGNLFEMREATGLPTAAGTYDIIINHDDTDNLAACAFFLTDVEQVDLAETVPAEDGPLNATNYTADGAVDTVTTITTTENNALILSIGGQGANGGTWDGRSPSPPLTQLFAGPNPSGSTFGGSSGNLASAAAVIVSEQENGNSFRVVHLVAAFNPVISGPPVAVGYEPVTLIETYGGNLSYRAIGNSLLTTANGSSCTFQGPSNDPLTVTSATLTLPDTPNGSPFSPVDDEFDSDVVAAYLYWFASGSFDEPFVSGNPAVTNGVAQYGDYDTVRFTAPDGSGGSVTTTLSATVDELFIIDNAGAGGDWDFYAAFKDVTSLLVGTNNELVGSDENPNGTYSVDSIGYDLRDPWDDDICVAGWSLIVVYENPYEQLRVVNLFHGFQPFQNSSFTLVPRNFRMAERNTTTRKPNGQITHVTVEGDSQITGENEGLTLQNQPGELDTSLYTALVTPHNPLEEEFNGTITRPFFDLSDLGNASGPYASIADVVPGGSGGPDGTGPISEYAYVFNSALDVGNNPAHGYEVDFEDVTAVTADPPDYDNGTSDAYGTRFGVDIDTHYIDGDNVGDPLYEFGDPLAASGLAEEITTEYSADQDLVLLITEVISVTNDDIADIEVTITEDDLEYKVGTTGDYTIEVRNNGSGGTNFGVATGFIELVGEMPTGYTVNTVSGTGWTCSTSMDNLAFTCTIDIPDTSPDWLDEIEPTLDDIELTVDIATPSPTVFPSLSNNAKVIVRVQHQDESALCRGGTIGELPTPSIACRAPQFDNVNDLQGGVIDINDLEDKTANNNNVDSITTEVRGTETDLKIEKVSSVLVEDTTNVTLYTITVTNNGPDDITSALTLPTITVLDNEPTDLDFVTTTEDIGGWACVINAGAPDQLECNFTGNLAAGASSAITVLGDVAGATAGNPVSNTAQVLSGQYNFDIVPGSPGENSDTDNTSIQATPPIISDRFLFSVSAAAANNLTSIGGLSNFTDNDIVFYNPSGDTAELFIDSQNTVGYSVDDPNALHLMPSGLIILSANTDGNSIGTGTPVNFDRTDLVIYNRITNTAQLLFDGSVISDGTGGSIPVNIDSVYVINDGTNGDPVEFVFSTAGAASGPQLGGGTLNWSDSDLVRYDGTTGEFELYLDAEDDNVFDADDAQVDANYIRVNSTDPDAIDDIFVFSSEIATEVGDNDISFGLDDLAQLEVTAGTTQVPTTTASELLFRGNLPPGIFTTSEADLKINALHLIETGYLGKFEITEATAGNACTPARIRIRKLKGNTSNIDDDYTGTIIISTDTGDGMWSVDTGTPSNLTNNYTAGTIGQTPPAGDTDNGQALYTFDPSDNGEVILTLMVDVSSPPVSVNISVTRGFESFVDVLPDVNGSPFDFTEVVQTVEYLDEFESLSFSNNDGGAAWATSWLELDYLDGTDPTSGEDPDVGNIQIIGGKLTLTSNSTTNAGPNDPSIARAAGIGLFNATEDVVVSYKYGYANVTNTVDSVELQINHEDDDLSYVTIRTYDGLDGTSGSDLNESINLSLEPAAAPILAEIGEMADPSLYLRWVVTSGYVLGTFTVDDFEVATGTTDCNISGLSHYSITIPDNGLACVTSVIRIEAQDAFNNLVAPGAGSVLQISTTNGAGSWVSVVTGPDTLTNNIAGSGDAEYTFAADQTFVELGFNYTNPAAGDVNVDVLDITNGNTNELQNINDDPTRTWDEAGLAFYDETGNSYNLPMQIAGKPSSSEAPVAGNITLQLVRSVPIPGENAAAACESLVDTGDIVTIDLVGVCIDPDGCDVGFMDIEDTNLGTVTIPVVGGSTMDPHESGTPVALTFADYEIPTQVPPVTEENIGATLDFTYPDAGKIQIHGQYEIPLNDDIAGTLSGNSINGGSNTFIVRPFGFDIDFSDDRAGGGTASLANDANGPAFARAGVGFDATVSAVAWESADDIDDDGIPDATADLSNNSVTTNFDDGDTSGITTSIVEITIGGDAGVPDQGPNLGVAGTLVITGGPTDIVQTFSDGQSGPVSLAIDEVGIFDLSAQLVDDAILRDPINYFDETVYSAAESIAGTVANVGRIYPNNFELMSSSFGPRVNQNMSCAPSSAFTYMGEDFGLNMVIEAKNAQGITTNNYFGDFAKLTDLNDMNISAVIDFGSGEADVDLTSRLVNSTLNPIPSDFTNAWLTGSLTIDGDMNFARPTTGEEAPRVAVQIAFNPTDLNGDVGVAGNDVVLDAFDVDIDDGMTEDVNFVLAQIGSDHEFRYGRLIIENAIGPETEDLEILIRIEYFDGDNFVTNTLDNCTSILYDFSAGTKALDFVSGSYDPPQPEPVGVDYLEPGDTVIEGAPGSDVTINVYNGATGRAQDGDNDDDNDPDRPFFVTAPDPEGDNELSGRVIIQLDLSNDDMNLTTPLDFLQYNWRTDGDLYDETPEVGADVFNDNPRAVIEFGSYRGHDRVINWQELFITN